MKKLLAVGLSIVVFLVLSRQAFPEEESDAQDAGHPVRVAAYILHPIGWVLYQAIFRPAHAFVSLPGVRDVFGHEEDVFEKPAWEQGARQVCPVPPEKHEAKPAPEEAPVTPPEQAPGLKAPQPPAESPQPQTEPQPPAQQQPGQSTHEEPQSKAGNIFRNYAEN